MNEINHFIKRDKWACLQLNGTVVLLCLFSTDTINVTNNVKMWGVILSVCEFFKPLLRFKQKYNSNQLQNNH